MRVRIPPLREGRAREREAVRKSGAARAAGKMALLIIMAAAAVAGIVFYLGRGAHAAAADADKPPVSLRLNEVMASNKGAVPDAYGGYPDYVEIYNAGDGSADLSGYGLSDDLLAGAKYVFPAGSVIGPGEFFLVWCAGEEKAEDGNYASFKINASEELVFYETNGNVIESLPLRGVAAGQTLSRTEGASGAEAWVEMAPSPGFPNDEAGVAAYAQSLLSADKLDLHINEFMASNQSAAMDGKGRYSDWIELYNASGEAIDLSGFGVSDSLAQPMKYVLPEGVSIPAGGYLLLWCSGEESAAGEAEIHVPFGLRAYEEDVVLSNPMGRVVDSYSYSRQEGDMSMARMPDGTGGFTATAQPTPGYPNTDAGYAAFQEASAKPLGSLYISEMMPSNRSALSHNESYPDWVELYNAGGEAVQLGGFALSDSANNPAKWVFPDIAIGPGERLLLYADGTGVSAASALYGAEGDEAAQKKNLALNFRLRATGETLYLFDPEGLLVDKLACAALPMDVSCGRDEGSGALRCYKEATPGAPNSTEAFLGVTAAPQFSLTPGVYAGKQSVALTAGAGESIHYTLDASEPTQESPVYSGPIPVEKNTVIRAAAFREGYIGGAVRTGTFLLKEDGVNHALPVMCLVSDPKNLWDGKTGIYAYGDRFDTETTNYTDMLVSANFYEGKESEKDQENWTRPGHFSVFDDAGREVFAQDLAMRIGGAYGRGRAQKGFNLIARDEYGKDRLEYAFFENRPFTEYKALSLRAGAQDQNYSKIRDELATGLLEGTDMHILVQAYKPYVLYLNGEYWGVYFMKEKRNRFFVAQHEGVENAMDMDLIKSATRVSHGTAEDWAALVEFAKSHDLSRQSNFEKVAAEVDMESFADYMIAEIWAANTDTWNVQYYKLPGGKWRFIYYDFCWSMRDAEHQTLSYRRGKQPALSDFFNAVLENELWRDAFIRRFAYALENVYTPARIEPLLNELYAAVEPEIAREREKFNAETFMGVKQLDENLGDYEKFQSEIERVRKFCAGRNASIKAQLQKEFSLSDSYMQEVFGA